jgi:hypothetical protein
MNPDEPTPEQISPDEPSSDEPSTPPPPRKRPRWAVLLLIGGTLLGLAPMAKKWPHDHQIQFRIEDGANDVTRFDVEWTRLDGDGPAEVVSGSSRLFERGHAPEIINVDVHLPNGSYVLDIRLEHADRVDAIQRRVTLGESDRITIPLRAERLRP